MFIGLIPCPLTVQAHIFLYLLLKIKRKTSAGILKYLAGTVGFLNYIFTAVQRQRLYPLKWAVQMKGWGLRNNLKTIKVMYRAIVFTALPKAVLKTA